MQCKSTRRSVVPFAGGTSRSNMMNMYCSFMLIKALDRASLGWLAAARYKSDAVSKKRGKCHEIHTGSWY